MTQPDQINGRLRRRQFLRRVSLAVLAVCVLGTFVSIAYEAFEAYLTGGPNETSGSYRASELHWWVASSEVVRNFGLAAFGLFGSLFAVIGYYFALDRLENDENRREDERHARIDERYAEALKMLGHEQIDVRGGGVFELEQLGQTSTVHLGRVMRSLQSYMRGKSVSKMDSLEETKCDVDVQDALAAYSALLELRIDKVPKLAHHRDDVLRQLNRLYLVGYDASHRIYLRDCNLTRTDLRGAILRDPDLSGANLAEANLRDAHITNANLTRADLTNANLNGTKLYGVNLTEALIWHEWRKENDGYNPELGMSRFGIEQATSLHALGWPVFDRSKMLFFKSIEDAHKGKTYLSVAEVREAIGLPPEPDETWGWGRD